MKNSIRRLIAGVSAAALLMSAVGFDAFMNMVTRDVAAVETGKNGRSTGFSKLEQDTDKDIYNTGYGLHTNKTATEVNDGTGRTFDVNLESWYVGENPVDVATILDASGSMAWTVDTLDPLEITDEMIENINKKYNFKSDSPTIKDLRDWQNNAENDGYLPQDAVDMILDPAKTDNSKLSYADYMYYVYEERSSVSEFVPLGYWDGGIDPKNDSSLIGYYPFSGDLKNKAPKATDGATGMLINHPGTGENYNTEKSAQKVPEAVFSTDEYVNAGSQRSDDKGLDIRKTALTGGVLLDSPKSEKFTIKMKFSEGHLVDKTNQDQYGNTTFLYITDGENFYKFYRRGGTSVNRMGVDTPTKTQFLNINKVFNASDEQEWTFDFDFTTNKLKLTTDDTDIVWTGTTGGKEYSVDLTTKLDTANLQVILGYTDNPEEIEKFSDVYIKNVEISDDTTTVANYSFSVETKSLQNSINEENATFVTQGDYNTKIEILDLEPQFSSDNKSLDVCKTGANGAVLLDAMPNSNDYTLSFKMKINKGSATPTENQNIIYVGDGSQTDGQYQRIYRRSGSSSNHIGILNESKLQLNQFLNGDNKTSYNDAWATITVTVNGKNAYVYVNGKQKYKKELGEQKNKEGKLYNDLCKWSTDSLDKLDLEQVKILLAGLWNADNYKDAGEIYLDDVYVFKTALDSDTVKMYFSDDSLCKIDGATHAQSVIDGETVDIAQISNGEKRLGKNTNIDQRRGWYYVNSMSDWDDITGCLASGKQYIGIFTDDGLTGSFKDMAKDIATVPSAFEDDKFFTKSLSDGNNDHDDYKAPSPERSIRFYVDEAKHLRCFVWTGDTTKSKDNARTFCSIVYEKQDGQKTKYEELNSALNSFYQKLAENSDLSNTSVVRFSTINAVDKDKTDKTETNLKNLIMKDWTNWSDYYQNVKNSGAEPDEGDYLHDLLIPKDGETATDTEKSSTREDTIEEYPYVMTGGTYTWTGLKAFYDNMVKKDDLKSGDRVYDIANDARDKYLIIFTDGRDNTVGSSDTKFCEKYSPKGHEVSKDADLAKAWTDKLKNEGYTIYCVMMATGSISPDANEEEYNKAKNFLETLAGTYNAEELKADYQKQLDETTDSKLKDELQEKLEELKKDPENHIIVVNPALGDESTTVKDAFQQILNDIQQPREDYTVQDYIDPRFDLVDGDGNLYQLGADGKITIKNPAGGKSTYTVGDVIDNPYAIGCSYKPIASEMVNRTLVHDSKGDYYDYINEGRGSIYYDDDKDMYYLRWTDQTIPMEDEAFDTATDGGKKLDVWSAIIRLQAKDDFIGGNNILTNGNEAGENLVYSDATIENMDKNPTLYFTEGGTHSLRKKLEVLSGTNRKINAVDAGGVSQAVYGDGIDIPSSGFPRVTVNVRLKPLDAKNLNDVIYMGEVLSPTMMLADLENGYMEGSYYLEYLRRYAYRLYGKDADKTPLLDLLNEWLKIDNEEETAKTFTIPYIYLPDPVYENDKLKVNSVTNRVEVSNSTGASWDKYDNTDFADLNLRDVTGFITYTWKRDKGSVEEQQLVPDSDPKQYDITKEYVVKNTDQIVYNLQLKFTPLHEGALEGFSIDDEKFITADTTGELGDKFFTIGKDSEFSNSTESKWVFTNRSEYLKAMVKEQHTYTPHVIYNDTTGKWQLKESGKVPDKDTYDWDKEYKKVVGNAQIEGENLTKYYTQTPENVGFADKKGDQITDQTGAFTGTNSKENVCSLVANTTYVKDVVNGALALELIVDGTYLKQNESPIKSGKEYKIIATRYYDDPIDPLPYNAAVTEMNADTGDKDETTGVAGKKYQLTFQITDTPADPQEHTLYQVWAELENVEVDSGSGTYKPITDDGFFAKAALPIGTYVIDTTDNKLETPQFQMGKNEHDAAEYFKYLKIDNAPESYTYDKFPESVYNASQTAPDSTGVDEYLIKNGGTDYSQKNIAVSNRNKDSDNQILTFYFGTVKDKEVGTGTLHNTKGDSHLVDEENDYAKDRLGIILLSADPNSLAISKTVTNTEKAEYFNHLWEFTVTFEPDKDAENMKEFNDKNALTGAGFTLNWYKNNELTPAGSMGTDYPETIKFTGSDGKYTATIYLKDSEKVVITGLPEGKWQVTETDETGTIFYSAHNNMDEKEDHEFSNATKDDIQLNPASHVDFVNEFPHALPSAGGTGRTGINIIIYCGIMFVVAAGLYFAIFYRKKRKISDEQQR